MRKVILFLTTFWVVIYSNARMLDVLPTYKIVHLFPIPQVTRLLELLIITFLYLLSLTTKMTKRILLINLCILAYLCIAVSTLVLDRNLTLDGIQDIYIRVAPFFFFAVIAQAQKATSSERSFFIRFFLIVLGLNILIAISYQIPFYGYYEDNMNGFFEDAHMFGSYLAVFSIVFFYDYINNKRLISLLLSLGLVFISFFPRNEKVIFLNFFIIVSIYIYNLIRRSKGGVKKMAVMTILGAIMLSGFIYIQKIKDEEEALRRANIAITVIGIENIGPVVAWPMAFNEIKKSVFDLFFGVGAGQYGWIAASRNVAEGKGSVHSNLFEFEFGLDNVNNSGFLFRTNTWSSLLAEYGILGFLTFVIPLILIVKGVKIYRTTDRTEKNLKMAFYSLLIIVAFQGFFTPYSNWSASALMFPMMYIAAYFHSKPQNRITSESESSEVFFNKTGQIFT